MTLSPRAIEAAANEIRKVRLLLVGGSGASIPSDHLYAEAAIRRLASGPEKEKK